MQEMNQLENILAFEKRQLSEIQEEREECDNGELVGIPDNSKKIYGSIDKSASGASVSVGVNILSSMVSNTSQIKGIGSGIASIGADLESMMEEKKDDFQADLHFSVN